MDDITVQVGFRIRLLREARGLSQEKLAELAGLHRVYVGQVERGEKCPTIITLDKIAGAMGVEIADLVK
jgi:transcriptional regulator with XRE-family HTH domain